MGIKDSTETWVRGKPVQAMVVIGLVGLVIGGLVGVGAGFKIEQNRTKSDVAALKAQIKAGGGGTGAGADRARSVSGSAR